MNIQLFSCCENKIVEIPREINAADKLEEFDCSHNKITNLPKELGELFKLKILHIYENNLLSLLPKIKSLNAFKYYSKNGISIKLPDHRENSDNSSDIDDDHDDSVSN